MRLDRMLDRCESLESRAATLYRGYAASARNEPALGALWTEMAREEEQHARSIAQARSRLEATEGWRTWIDGWEEALDDVECRLAAAEQLGGEATLADQLSAALELETSELDALRHALLGVCHQADVDASAAHAVHLAETAARLSDDPHVRLQAAILRARTRLNESA